MGKRLIFIGPEDLEVNIYNVLGVKKGSKGLQSERQK